MLRAREATKCDKNAEKRRKIINSHDIRRLRHPTAEPGPGRGPLTDAALCCDVARCEMLWVQENGPNPFLWCDRRRRPTETSNHMRRLHVIFDHNATRCDDHDTRYKGTGLGTREPLPTLGINAHLKKSAQLTNKYPQICTNKYPPLSYLLAWLSFSASYS